MMADLIATINAHLPDATEYGQGGAVDELTEAWWALAHQVRPVAELLEEPDAREALTVWRDWIGRRGAVHLTESESGAICLLLDLLLEGSP